MMNNNKLIIVVAMVLMGTLPIFAAPPAAPSNLEVVPRYGASQGFVLTWQDNAGDEDGFKIERRINSGGFSEIISIAVSNITDYTDLFVPPLLTDEVQYQVRAYNGDGNSGYSNISLATTLRALWPLQDGSHDSSNGFADYTPGNIWKFHEGFADYTPGNIWKFHEGFDSAGNGLSQANERVVIVTRGGRIQYINNGYAGGLFATEVNVDGSILYDVYLHTHVTTGKAAGDIVAAGEAIGRINATYFDATSFPDHIHFEVFNSWIGTYGYAADASNFYNPILHFTTNADSDPQINAPALQDYNGDGNTILMVNKDNVATELDVAYGGVDIIAEAFDDMTATMTFNQNVYKVGYWIDSGTPGGNDVRSAGTPYVLNEINNDWFTASPPVEDLFYQVYDSTRTGASNKSGHYIVTNTTGTTGSPGNVDEDQYWNTSARLGSGSMPNGTDHATAFVNEEARFDEGYYMIHILLEDLVNPQVDATREILVDNFLPYVRRVTIHSGPVLIYEARWEWDGFRLRLDPPDPNAAMFGVADRTQDIEIEVEFSEPMKNTPTVSIAPLGISPTLTSTEPVNQMKIWRGTVSSIDISDAGDDDGQHYLTISGMDLNDNLLYHITANDPIDPVVTIKRNGSGTFPGPTGDDTLHRFRIGPVSGIQNILLVCMKHPGLADPPDTPTTYAAQIQTMLSNYFPETTWGSITFIVDVAPAWMDLDHAADYYYAADMNPLIELTEEAIGEAVAQGVSFAGVDRIMILTNDTLDRGDQATTGYWPYEVPGMGTEMISASVHTLVSTAGHYTHAAGHHLGLVDLYPYPHVVTPRPFVGQWGHMSDRDNQPHFISWSKQRLGWITGSGQSYEYVARPDVGSPVSVTHTISPTETDTGDTKLVVIEVADRLFYFVENRKQVGLDSGLSDSGVLITKVNEYVEPGAGPAIVSDPTADNILDDACYRFSAGDVFNDLNVGLTITILTPAGDNENIRIDYDPPSDRNDVSITKQDGRWQTPDIWVDAPDEEGNWAVDPEAVDEAAKVGVPNRLYYRIRNNGDAPATDFRIIIDICEPWTTGENFLEQDQEFITILGGGDPYVNYIDWTPIDGVHTCVQVRIVDVANDDNYANNDTQENIWRFEVPGGSPYQPVDSNFVIHNPYDETILVYLRVDGLPDTWTKVLTPEKTILGPDATVPAHVRIIPDEEHPRCSRENVTITAYTPRGDTLIPLGAITLALHMVTDQGITVGSTIHCKDQDRNEMATFAVGYKPECTIVTQGCTDPIRPYETIYLLYEAPDGSTIVREVITDEYGCYEDFFTIGEAGEWNVTAVIEGTECNGRGEAGPVDVRIPDPGLWEIPGNRLLFSFHFGGSFPLDSFADDFDNGFSLNLDLEYRILKRLGILAYLGHHQFYSLTGNMFIQHYSVNARIYLPLIYWVVFIQGGVGYYRPENGSQVLGYNVGAGFQMPIAGRLALEVSTNFHYVQMDNPPYWLAIQMGFIF